MYFREKTKVMITFKLLEQFPEIIHFSTTRHNGKGVGNYKSFNLSPNVGDAEEDYLFNKYKLCKALKINPEQLITPFQTHETNIREINQDFSRLSDDDKQKYLYGVDALVTHEKNVCIGIATADCVPMLCYDPVQKVIAAIHSGRKGTCERISEKVIDYLKEKYKSKPSDIYFTLAPCISVDAYEVGEELIEYFEKNNFPVNLIFQRKTGKRCLDLKKANEWLLIQNGILAGKIEVSPLCTYTNHQDFFSARRLGIKSGRMLTGVMMK